MAAYDGHHIAVYVADFSGPHDRLAERGLISEESDQYQYRFQAIFDPDTRRHTHRTRTRSPQPEPSHVPAGAGEPESGHELFHLPQRQGDLHPLMSEAIKPSPASTPSTLLPAARRRSGRVRAAYRCAPARAAEGPDRLRQDPLRGTHGLASVSPARATRSRRAADHHLLPRRSHRHRHGRPLSC